MLNPAHDYIKTFYSWTCSVKLGLLAPCPAGITDLFLNTDNQGLTVGLGETPSL